MHKEAAESDETGGGRHFGLVFCLPVSTRRCDKWKTVEESNLCRILRGKL